MNRLGTILVLLRCPSDLGAPLDTAAWMARATGARIELFLDPRFSREIPGGNGVLSVEERLRSLRVPRFATRLEECSEAASRCARLRLESERALRREAPLVVVGALQCEHEREALDPETVDLIEAIREPVLLLPFGRKARLPWPRIVTPMSGEIRDNRALTRSIELANQLQVPIDIIHVVEPVQGERDGSRPMAQIGDQAHHELHAMIEDFISDACPFCTPSEKRVIRDFQLVHGDATTELLRMLSGSPVGMIAVEWKGSFMRGHAETLKALLTRLDVPVLLVRQSAAGRVDLRAGHRLAG